MNNTYCDPALAAWLRDEGDDIREVIVEAHLPQRQILMRLGEKGRMVPDRMVSASPPAERVRLLEELNHFLAGQMHLTTTVLKAAGAIAVRASGEDVRHILEHPMVKAIRPNRKL